MNTRGWSRVGRGCCAAVVLAGAAACSGVLNSSDAGQVSTDYEPPKSWESALLFQFMDSTFQFAEPEMNTAPIYGAQVEFDDGRQRRVVTGRDVYHADNGAVRTPWYRVEPDGREHATTLRLTIGDATGQQALAEYPLVLRSGEFYFIEFGVYTRTYGPGSYDGFMQGWRSYPAPAGARRAPGDSLWVSYRTRGRYCFNCPS